MTKKRKVVKKNIDLLQNTIEELENKKTEIEEKYLRLLAEWENYRKRTTKEKSNSIEYGKELIISQILPILDDFQRAEKAGEKNQKMTPPRTKRAASPSAIGRTNAPLSPASRMPSDWRYLRLSVSLKRSI